ncbi:MAG TPA: sialidase family protein [Kofleriaceae bacterium]
MMTHRSFALAISLSVAACATTAPGDERDELVAGAEQGVIADGVISPFILFKGNTGNGSTEVHHSYRIPAIINAGKGRLIAVAEGRVDSAADYGNINLVMRRSTDNGATWARQEQFWNAPDRLGTIGNPTLVYDPAASRVWLFASENDSKHSLGGAGGLTPVGVGDRRTWVRYTDPDKWVAGSTANIWSTPVNVTSSVTPKDYTWDAMGPGIGIVTAKGGHPGRIVIPARGRVIYSDDHGASWHYHLTGDAALNETTVAELASGALYVNARSQDDSKRRQIKTSQDDGATWTAWHADSALTEAKVEASVLRYNFDAPARLAFFNPTSTTQRDNMEIKLSYDDGATWPIRRVVDAGQGGYSSMIKTSDFSIAALYESGVGSDSYDDIKLTKLDLKWILNGRAEPKVGWDQVVRADLDGNGDDEPGATGSATARSPGPR